MKKNFNLLYGFKKKNLVFFERKIEKIFNLKLNKHYSIYYGGDYSYAKTEGNETIILQLNKEYEDDLSEEDFPDYHTLLRINETSDYKKWKKKLSDSSLDAELLRETKL